MVCAGAAAGVYDLQTMAFETVESMIRAGEFSELIFLRVFFSDEVFVACCPPPRRDSHPDVLHASVLGLAGCVKFGNLLNEELLSDCWSYCCIICGVGRLS